MSRWTKIKIVIGIIGSILVILIIVLVVSISKFIGSNYGRASSELIDHNKQVSVKKLNMDDDFAQIVTNTAKRNVDWTNLPLSKLFKKKYNNKVGILGNDDNYTSLYGSNYMSNKEEQIVVLYVAHNYKQEEYYIHYLVNDKNELDDVEIVGKKLLYDENGNEVIYKASMDNDNYEFNISRLAYPFGGDRDPRDYINMTYNYIENYYNGFITIPHADRITALPITKISNYNNNIVYLEVEYCIYNGDDIGDWYGPMYYKIKYKTDVNLWLDDVEVEEVSKEEIDRLLVDADMNNK